MLERTSFLCFFALLLGQSFAQTTSSKDDIGITPSDSIALNTEYFERKRLEFYWPSNFGVLPPPKRDHRSEIIPYLFKETKRYYEFRNSPTLPTLGPKQ